MAITIVQRPQKFTPSDNPVIWQFQSNASNFFCFEVELIDHATSARIDLRLLSPTPDLISGGNYGVFMNASRQLNPTVNWQADNSTTIITEMVKPVRAYRIKITEKLKSGNVISNGAVYDDLDDVNYVFNAKFEELSFNNYSWDNYVVHGSNVVRFLSNKPTNTSVNKYSTEYLYFMQNQTSALTVKIRIYNANGTFDIEKTASATNISTVNMYRVNVSPKAIKATYGESIAPGQYYTVQIFNGSGSAVSELKTYYMKDAECWLELVNVLFVNQLGGIDSYQFVNPQTILNVTRLTTKRNTYKVTNGNYTNITGDVYNISNQIIDSTGVVNMKMWTRILQDPEVFWLGEMENSKQVFIELTDRKLLPVNVVSTSYNYQRKRYMSRQEVNQIQWEIQFSDQFIPSLNAGTSYVISATFKNEERRGSFTKQGCSSPSQYGETLDYVVPAGTYTSELSIADANAQADADIAANGQAWVNAHGSCLASTQYGNDAIDADYYSQSCYGSTPVPNPYHVTIAANTYFSYISKADANAQAQAAAQAQANASGTCATGFGNQPQSVNYYSQWCGAGTPDAYPVTVAANTYFASTQADANQMALDWIASHGQGLANTYGGCLAPTGTTITVTVALIDVPTPGAYDNWYVYVETSAPVTDNILVDVDIIINGNHDNGITTLSIYAGDSQSSQTYLGQYLGGLSVEGTIVNVYPNPDIAGTNYTW